ncbi:MAG: OmpA family protein, partial [Bacteroidota bacterium]|nr:OmpA family protein [Bacteroidota bacterium]
ENSAKLNIQAKAELENLLILLHENDDVSFKIIGHADGREALNTANAKLSENRALAVSAFLTKAGIKKSRISQIEGAGNKAPKITEVNSRTRSVNRRVEIIITNF